MRAAQVRPDGTTIRWVELPGAAPARVYIHGLGSSSPPYYAAAATHPVLAGYRSLLIDLLGFGISDRPTEFDYTLEGHADLLASALTQADVGSADIIAHSMGGAVAVMLASRHPQLVRCLVLVDASLDPYTPDQKTATAVSTIIGGSEAEFLATGWAQTLELAGPHWAATMRLAGREALHRTARYLVRQTRPTVREILLDLRIHRTFLYPADNTLNGAAELTAGGVQVVAIPDCGHNIMIDNVDVFVSAVATALTR